MSSTFQNVALPDEISEKLLGFETASLKQLGAFNTGKEISQQPLLWRRTWKLIIDQREQIEAFLAPALKHTDLQIVLTGAGSSAFIGHTLEGPLQARYGQSCRAIATTELLSHPDHYFSKKPTLLISFARSGDSPESSAAIKLASMQCTKLYNLIITCNPDGRLTKELKDVDSYLFLLPPDANDQALAMTGSFTSMLLAGLLITRLAEIEKLSSQIDLLCEYGDKIIGQYAEAISAVANLGFTRAVFLGSGPFKAIAAESALKLQELTDGAVICKDDSFLNFRHGPKAVINASTLLVYLFSNDKYVMQYESDLINAVSAGERGVCRIGIDESATHTKDLDLMISLNNDGEKLDEDFLAIVSVLPAQLLGFFKSLQLGMHPDSPSKTQAITRVVQGVNIYPYTITK